MIRARAPLRISFGGGGTDVPPYPELHGGVVLSATIDRYTYCTVGDSASGYAFHSTDLELQEFYPDLASLKYNGKLDLAKAVVRELASKSPKKFALSLFSEAPPGSGLGSSSSLMVAIIKGVSEFLGTQMPRHSLAEMAYNLERVVLGIKGGYQDQYAATFGGFNFIEFGKHVVVNPLRISEEILEELHASIVLLDTGRSRLSSNILSRQIASYEREESEVMESLSEMKRLAYDMKSSLLSGDIGGFAKLMGEEWECKKRLDTKISDASIDGLYQGALKHGAIGGKVLGAGGGGHMVFLAPLNRKRELTKHLASKGYQEIHFGFDGQGVVSWKVEGERVIV